MNKNFAIERVQISRDVQASSSLIFIFKSRLSQKIHQFKHQKLSLIEIVSSENQNEPNKRRIHYGLEIHYIIHYLK